jgi:hypothetical protein
VEKRRQDLERMITDNRLYYDSVRAFGREQYIKLSGNHDRYASSLLEGMIESAYWTGVVKDVLLVDRPVSGSRTRYLPRFVVTHGHQFDHACVPPHANKVGESISECISWGFQGPDRTWRISDTRNWTKTGQKTFSNVLSSVAAKPITTGHPDLELFLEILMSHEIAWEYFENDDPYMAFVREVCTGDEFFKYRHMDEDKLANALLPKWAALERFPTLICGHTHEVRDQQPCGRRLQARGQGRAGDAHAARHRQLGPLHSVSQHGLRGPLREPDLGRGNRQLRRRGRVMDEHGDVGHHPAEKDRVAQRRPRLARGNGRPNLASLECLECGLCACWLCSVDDTRPPTVGASRLICAHHKNAAVVIVLQLLPRCRTQNRLVRAVEV